MGKILILSFICLSFLISGCDAFKDHYDTPSEDVLEDLGVELEEGTDQEEGGEIKVDYSADETSCEGNSKVVVSLVKDIENLSNSGWTIDGVDESIVSASKPGQFTVEIKIENDNGQLVFTLKRTGDEEFSACNISFRSCEVGECFAVKSIWADIQDAQIEVYKLNQKDGDKVVNAGSYDIEFNKSNLGEPGLSLEGEYFTED